MRGQSLWFISSSFPILLVPQSSGSNCSPLGKNIQVSISLIPEMEVYSNLGKLRLGICWNTCNTFSVKKEKYSLWIPVHCVYFFHTDNNEPGYRSSSRMKEDKHTEMCNFTSNIQTPWISLDQRRLIEMNVLTLNLWKLFFSKAGTQTQRTIVNNCTDMSLIICFTRDVSAQN